MKRRLTTIMAIDVAGYSRLMGHDEAGTLSALKAHRLGLIDPEAGRYGGRTIKLMGDGALMEFSSVVDAVRFAVNVQCAMTGRNADVPKDRRIEFRIGINVGDVIVDDHDIYGDGVNIAARIENLAPAGGICAHQTVRDQVRDKLDLNFDDLGEVEVKNIERPVRVFNVVLDDKAASLAKAAGAPAQQQTRRKSIVTAAVAAVVLLVAGVVWWHTSAPDFAPLNATDMDQQLPEKTSIAVLAFDDLSQGSDRGFLSDAISEDIIAKLSRFPDFFVIARNSSFFYRDKAADVRDIARELGVRYVVEGSQQKSGDRLRITAQLVDATAGNTIWAETYDRDLVDIFAVQDEIARMIVATLEQNVNLAEYDRLLRTSTENLRAYELVNRGRAERLKFTPEGNQQAKLLSEKALDLDPGYSEAYFSLAWVHINCDRWGWCAGRPQDDALDQALAAARKAVELDPDSSLAHWVLAHAIMQSDDLEQAETEYNRAIALNPNSAGVLAGSIETLVYLGRADEAIDRLQAAIRLNPHHPDWYLWSLAWAQYFAGDYEAGLASMRHMAKIPNLARRTQAALFVRLGRMDDAQKAIAELLANMPGYTVEKQRQSLKFRDRDAAEGFLNDLAAAGLPAGQAE